MTKIPNYRDIVFKILPTLKFLDGFDQNEQEDEEEECKILLINSNFHLRLYILKNGSYLKHAMNLHLSSSLFKHLITWSIKCQI